MLTAAYKQRHIRINHENDADKNLAALRKFRGNMLHFQNAVGQVKAYYEGDSEIDILMRFID